MALHYNLLTYPLVIGSIMLVIWNTVDLVKNRHSFLDAFHKIKISKLGFIILFLLMIANWLYNIHMGF